MTSILLVANTSWYVYNFRLPLIKDLKLKGYGVDVVAPFDNYTHLLEHEGVKVHIWKVSRQSINPFLELNSIIELIRLYRSIRPDLVHHFTIKACIYGTIAAKFSNVFRVLNAVTGLGHVFLERGLHSRLMRRCLRPLYRTVFMARRSTVIFQNSDDQRKFIRLGITESNKSVLIRGSGVDIEHFKPLKTRKKKFNSPPQLLFPSRIIRQKGIYELLAASRKLWGKGLEFELLIAGKLDSGNRSSLSLSELKELRREKRVSLLGHIDDMSELYSQVDLVILPSWREGLSRALIEAAAMELPIITTDVPGCRDVIDHGGSGLLVPVKDTHSLMLAIQLLLSNQDFAYHLGETARRKVVNEFQVSLINEKTVAQYERLLLMEPTKD